MSDQPVQGQDQNPEPSESEQTRPRVIIPLLPGTVYRPGPRGVIGLSNDPLGMFRGTFIDATSFVRYDQGVVDYPVEQGFPIPVEEGIHDDRYEIRAELPGFDPTNDVDIAVEHGDLTITANRAVPDELTHSEFVYGTSARTIRLPADADLDDITATYQRGILTISVAISARYSARRRITIETEEAQ